MHLSHRKILAKPTRSHYKIERGLDIVFFARKIGSVAGGLERMLIALMNELQSRGHRISLITLDRRGAEPHYKLDTRICWFQLDVVNPGISASFLDRVQRLIRMRTFLKSKKTDLVVGFQSGSSLAASVCSFGLDIKVIASERVSPDMWRYTRKGWLNRILDVYSLVLADRITVQFENYKKYYPRIIRNRIVTIPNPVYRMNMRDVLRVEREKIILYVARLCFQKNHRLLLSSFALIANEFKDWTIVLAGDGEYYDQVTDLIATLELVGRVKLVGSVVDVERLYGDSEIVAFPSLFEGFPNALAEALASGLPCVGLCETLGVNQLIQDGVNGFLVKSNPQDFADGLVKLMVDPALRYRMGEQARLITDRYPTKTSFDLWESTILGVLCE